MRLRQLQRRGRTFFQDSGLLQVLRSEINHELSSSTISSTGNEVGNMVEGFLLEWDNPWTQDVVLRRRPDHAFSDEIAVSSLLAPLRFQDEDPLPRNALMKVCIRKTGYDPILHFDCCVFRRTVSQSPWATMEATNEGAGTDFTIKRSYFHYPSSPLALSKHNPTRAFVSFSSLDPQLHKALKEYLVARGITPTLTDFILEHLHAKEHSQYVTWLRAVEGVVAKPV